MPPAEKLRSSQQQQQIASLLIIRCYSLLQCLPCCVFLHKQFEPPCCTRQRGFPASQIVFGLPADYCRRGWWTRQCTN